ncbi:TrmB family transcriptional regulator [Candidatus Bathyarchaeota archaeon]|nr:MAG: TrmB family transcriptional regulator [Candidatus Bathyarchaeota archaeon]
MTSSILNPALNDNNRSLGVKVLAADEFSVQSLMKLGLTEYEARIYVVLTKMGPRNASEISFLAIAHCSRQTREIHGRLAERRTHTASRETEQGNNRMRPGRGEPGDGLRILKIRIHRETLREIRPLERQGPRQGLQARPGHDRRSQSQRFLYHNSERACSNIQSALRGAGEGC